MEEKKCSPSPGSHHPPIPIQQSYPLDLSANSFGLSHQQNQQRPLVHHRHLTPHFAAAPDAARRPGIPPLSPYSQMPPRSPPSSSCSPFHSRSLSQPTFFSLDSLPPLSSPPPAPHALTSPAPTSMHLPPSEAAAGVGTADDSLLQQISRTPAGRSSPEGGGSGSGSGGRLPPRKAHRRSQSDVPFAVSSASAEGFLFQPPPQSPGTMAGPAVALPPPQRPLQQKQLVKQESDDWEKDSESGDHRSDGGDVGDDLISAYMNLDNLETLNSCEAQERRAYMDGNRLSGTRTNNENEAESSSVNESSGGGERKEGNKRSAAGDLMRMNSRHSRSLSMDSLMSKLNFGDESPRFPPSPGNLTGQLSRSGSMDGATATMLNLEFGNGEFNSAELKKIMANEKLAEMALSDPKRVKRILANRQSAARSKERKMRYISELEHKVQTLQTEATTLSAQLTLLQRDSAGLTSQNNELKFRIQSLEQQAQLRDALNQALTAEVHHLKLVTGEITEAQLSKNMNQQMHMSAQVFQLQSQQQQSLQVPCYRLQMPENQQQQQNNATSDSEKKC